MRLTPSVRRILLALFLIAAVGLFGRRLGRFSVVVGESMAPTLRPNDVVLARTLDENVRRGDIVIVTDDRNEEVIKRIVGLPGETVTLFRGFVYINRQRLAEPYLAKLTYTFKRDQDNEAAVSWQLAEDEYFVLGDNRLHSADSRHYGPVPRHRLQRAVDTPENSFRPTLSDLVLLENGRVVHQNRTSSALPPTPPKP